MGVNTCRVCLDTKYSHGVSFDDGGDWLQMYQFCFGVTILPYDIPRMLCEECSQKMQDFAQFKKQSLKADKLWRTTISVNISDKDKYIDALEKITIKEEDNNSDYQHDNYVNFPNNINELDDNYTSVKVEDSIGLEEDLKKEITPISKDNSSDYQDDNYDTSPDNIDEFHDNYTSAKNASIGLEKDLNKEITPVSNAMFVDVNCGVRKNKKYVNKLDDNNTSVKDEDSIEHKKDFKNAKQPSSNAIPVKVKGGDGKIRKYTQISQIKIPKCNYECKWCGKMFKQEKNYVRHSLKNKCKFKQLIQVPSVKRIQLVTSGIYYCGLCDMKSSNADDVNNHLNVHSSNNELSCKLCEYTGRDFADMETHRFFHQSYQALYNCHSCNKNCRTTVSLQFHYRSVHLKKPGGLCSVCNKIFTSFYSFRNHEKLHDTARYICDHCGRRYLYRHSIEAHMIDHGDYKGFVCHICGKKFKRNSNLKLHMQSVHDDTRVACTHCDKTFKNQLSLNEHLKRETGAKKFQCEVCSKCYKSQYLLSKHMFWHTDERPFACKLCGSTYKAKAQLNVHMRKHTGDLPFKCPRLECPRAFPSSSQLKVHLNVHSGKRRYKCLYCEKTFHNRSNVVTHCVKRHNVNDDGKNIQTSKVP